MIKRIILFTLIIFSYLFSFSQEIEMADKMREEGKIYVVIAVILSILIGLLVYLFTIDKRVSKIEKK